MRLLALTAMIVQASCRDSPSLVALFTFVARDPVTNKATQVNPVDPQTEADKASFAERQQVADDRKAQRTTEQKAGATGQLILSC